ncbi:nitrous oxide-stimulated promoter family protein [Psychrobacillus antarcticus]|uniref:nitrous oxide-stimulated promoter family protein n=1 Tax=Psychrobacillus antarcticus TaxID=2879115 RepID=UPI002407DE6A|nr:nitrous oxide-stimulated promoter family protein [Psychrobacillus antarcticus]
MTLTATNTNKRKRELNNGPRILKEKEPTPKYRKKIKIVMRFSGPWMLVYHPILAIQHVWQEKVTHRNIQ